MAGRDPEPDPTFIWTDPARDVAEALEHNERAFLYGPSGTGKSSLLRQIGALVAAAGDLRRAHANEELTTVITTRRLLALCARLERGNDFPRALSVCVLNKVPSEDRKVIAETFDHHVGPMG